MARLTQLKQEGDHIGNAPQRAQQFADGMLSHLSNHTLTSSCFEYLLVRVILTMEW